MKFNIKSIQKEELEMILEIERISKLNNLTYYLAYGSVIGAVREKGFIEWDTDIDIIVPYNEYNKFCRTVSDNLSDHLSLLSYNNDKYYDSLKARVYKSNYDHSRIHIDIFPMVGIANNKFIKIVLPKVSYLIYRIYFVKKVDPKNNYNSNRLKRILVYLFESQPKN